MKTPLLLNLSKKHASEFNHSENSKKRRNYYEQFLQMLSRKTDAEKRAQIFGMDPFK